MQQKKKLLAILKKASRLLKVPILVARVRKSVNITRLISLKKSRMMRKKKFMLLKHYNYNYVHEYQFSPTNSSPYSPYYRRATKKRRFEELCSVLPIGKCLGMINAEREEYRGYPLMELKALPCIEYSIAEEVCHDVMTGIDGEDDDEDSIDERAEKFIERFYEEIRMQRKESFMQSSIQSIWI